MEKQYKTRKSKNFASLEVLATYDSGKNGFALWMITDGRVIVRQSDAPLNPTIDLGELKKLIAEYESLDAN
jgi:hypothetical protein